MKKRGKLSDRSYTATVTMNSRLPAYLTTLQPNDITSRTKKMQPCCYVTNNGQSTMQQHVFPIYLFYNFSCVILHLSDSTLRISTLCTVLSCISSRCKNVLDMIFNRILIVNCSLLIPRDRNIKIFHTYFMFDLKDCVVEGLYTLTVFVEQTLKLYVSQVKVSMKNTVHRMIYHGKNSVAKC